jgi:hypothetical protein
MNLIPHDECVGRRRNVNSLKPPLVPERHVIEDQYVVALWHSGACGRSGISAEILDMLTDARGVRGKPREQRNRFASVKGSTPARSVDHDFSILDHHIQLAHCRDIRRRIAVHEYQVGSGDCRYRSNIAAPKMRSGILGGSFQHLCRGKACSVHPLRFNQRVVSKISVTDEAQSRELRERRLVRYQPGSGTMSHRHG